MRAQPSAARRHRRLLGVAYPHPTTPTASVIMRANVSRDTKPEMRLRSALHRAGARYRVHLPIRVDDGRPVTVDVAFMRCRVAVFVDGCFWHACPDHGAMPVANRAYWERKLRRNRERDLETTDRLSRAGWLAIRVWEHEDAGIASERILAALAAGSRDEPAVAAAVSLSAARWWRGRVLGSS
jgi:DNA mismatch endonuclease, patch repair protein